ncbi:hypothetical protein G4V39_07505 [Thermosulfuriphilus ammonigenes]|uniref:Uncharacterized protein n=1 Tax=Thermosulfuriphilus ammonigenes TaxID=1936021 RepID=A0A6G7PWT9_9BACT|nr:CdaR family protein [Thermosulfuriphilus ammonigenes]MBA2847669.1 YbbR domain-containing protein [Thermosulfuriphilus ammonigenes]QIJ72122.1 hypothetical protein G4V39_07505 [Thermosulfuriphilus ammonigenes]
MKWQDVLGKDWVLKLLSLVFAIVLWFLVVGEENAEMALDVALELVNLPPETIIINDIPAEIKVRVSGPRSLLQGLSRQRISRVIDLSEAKPGRILIQITPESIRVPRGVRVVKITPSEIEIVLDRLVHKTLKIKVRTSGQLPYGFRLEKIVVNPDKIEVEGPKSTLEKLKVLETQAVDLSDMTTNFQRQVRLKLPPYVSVVKGDPMVTVTVIVQEIKEIKIFKVPVRLGGDNRPVVLKPSLVSIKVVGPLWLLKNLEPKEIRAWVETKNLKPGTYWREVKIALPDKRLRLLSVKPSRVKVYLQKAQESQNILHLIKKTVWKGADHGQKALWHRRDSGAGQRTSDDSGDSPQTGTGHRLLF